MGKTKKKRNTVSLEEETPIISTFNVDKAWMVIKDISAARAKEIHDDKEACERLYSLAEEAKQDFVEKVIPILQKQGEVILADDILAVVSTMALILANELFEQNAEIMEFLSTPNEEKASAKDKLTFENGIPNHW